MKLHALSLGLLASLAQAYPTRRSAIQKRTAITDVGTGFASLNGGTTGGGSATPVTVSDYAGLVAAVAGVEPKVVIITGPIEHSGEPVNIGSHTTLVGADSSVVLTGFGLLIRENKNVIVRNIAVAKVPASNGDAVGLQYAENVWLDHMDLSGDMNSEKDFYDGLCDITRKSSYVTLSNSYLHNHWKGSLIGHSDSNGAEDTGFLKVTQNNNYFQNIGSRTPSLRFGQAHIYNSYFEATDDGINVRQGAQVLVESNVFDGTTKPLYSVDVGGAVESDNVWGAGENTVPAGTLTSVEYPYELLGSGSVIASVVGTAGNTLTFATDGTVTGAPPRKGNETGNAPPGGYAPVPPPPGYPTTSSEPAAKTEPPTEGYQPTPKPEEEKKEKPVPQVPGYVPTPQPTPGYEPTPKPEEEKKEDKEEKEDKEDKSEKEQEVKKVEPVPQTPGYEPTPKPEEEKKEKAVPQTPGYEPTPQPTPGYEPTPQPTPGYEPTPKPAEEKKEKAVPQAPTCEASPKLAEEKKKEKAVPQTPGYETTPKPAEEKKKEKAVPQTPGYETTPKPAEEKKKEKAVPQTPGYEPTPQPTPAYEPTPQPTPGYETTPKPAEEKKEKAVPQTPGYKATPMPAY